MQPPLWVILLGGLFLFVLLVFQVLLGKRVIKLKGPLHWKVHRYNAYLILALGALHGTGALLVFGPAAFGR